MKYPNQAVKFSGSEQESQSPTKYSAFEGVLLPRLLTQEHLAKYLCKSTSWCERSRWAGTGPKYVKLGRHVRYRVEDVLEWIDSNLQETE